MPNFNVSVFSCLLLLFCCATVNAECSLVSTWEPWEPYQFKDPSGKVTGLDNDLINALAKQSGCKISLEKRPWKRTLSELKSGDSDMAPGASFSKERQAFAYFSEPYRSEKMSLMVRADEVANLKFNSVEDMMRSDIAIGVVRGYFYGDGFKGASNLPDRKARIQEANSDQNNLKKLLKGRLNGLLIDPFVGMKLAKEMDKVNLVAIHPVEISNSDIYFMFSKKSVSPETVELINKALSDIKASGEYDNIVNRYLN